MRVMVLVKANDASEAGLFPSPEQQQAMHQFNQDLIAAGIRRAADGLKPTTHARRIAFDGDRRTLIDGPFTPASAQLAGFWIWDVKDMDEALMWAMRCPNPMPGPSELEIRPLYGAEDRD